MIFTKEEHKIFLQLFGSHYKAKTKKHLPKAFKDYPTLDVRLILEGKVKRPKSHHNAIIKFWKEAIKRGSVKPVPEEGDGY
jgi:hypothetical protein